MSEEPVPMWAVVCDRCKKKHHNDEYTAWPTIMLAREDALGWGWLVEFDGEDICEDCAKGVDWEAKDANLAAHRAWRNVHRSMLCSEDMHAYNDHGMCLACREFRGSE